MCVIYLFTRTDADRPRHNTQPHKQTDAQSHRQTDRCTITQTDRGSNKKQTCTVVHQFCTVYGICVTINLVTSVSGAICCYSCRAFFRRSCHRNTIITGAFFLFYSVLNSVQCTVYSIQSVHWAEMYRYLGIFNHRLLCPTIYVLYSRAQLPIGANL